MDALSFFLSFSFLPPPLPPSSFSFFLNYLLPFSVIIVFFFFSSIPHLSLLSYKLITVMSSWFRGTSPIDELVGKHHIIHWEPATRLQFNAKKCSFCSAGLS